MKNAKKLLAIAIALVMLVSTLVSGLVVSAADANTLVIGTTEIVKGTATADVQFVLTFAEATKAPHSLCTITAAEGLTLSELKIDAVDYVSIGDTPVEDDELIDADAEVTINNDGKNIAAGKVLFESAVDSKAPTVNSITFTATFDVAADATCGEYAVNAEIDATNYDEADYTIDVTAGSVVVKHNYEAVVTAPTCVAEGYTTYTCACGDTYTGDTVAATGEHNYVDGVCDVCGAEEPVTGPVVDENITIRDVNVSIGACLEMRFRVTKSTISSDYASVDFVVIPTKYDTTNTNAFNEVVVDPIVLTNEPTSSYNVYWYKDVAMSELGLNIQYYVRCYDAKGNMVATSEIFNIVPSESLVATYTSTSNAKMKTVIADLLNMGTYAQIYFGNNNVNSDLKATVDAGEFVNIGIDQADASTSYGELANVNNTTWSESNPLDASVYRMAIILLLLKLLLCHIVFTKEHNSIRVKLL